MLYTLLHRPLDKTCVPGMKASHDILNFAPAKSCGEGSVVFMVTRRKKAVHLREKLIVADKISRQCPMNWLSNQQSATKHDVVRGIKIPEASVRQTTLVERIAGQSTSGPYTWTSAGLFSLVSPFGPIIPYS